MTAKKYQYGTLWHAMWGLEEDSTPWRLQEAVLLEVLTASSKEDGVVSAQVLLVLRGQIDQRYRKETFIFSPYYWELQRMLPL